MTLRYNFSDVGYCLKFDKLNNNIWYDISFQRGIRELGFLIKIEEKLANIEEEEAKEKTPEREERRLAVEERIRENQLSKREGCMADGHF